MFHVCMFISLSIHNDNCCAMYIINIVVDTNDDVCGTETQDDWVELSWEMRYIRGVNRSYVDNLGPPGIGETPSRFWWTLIQPQ